MPDPYTQEQSEEDIAGLRGDADRMGEHFATSALFVNGNQIYGDADTGTTTVTALSQTRLTTSYTIPANEAAVGSCYEVRFGGSGTWGATQQTLAFTLLVGAATLFSGSVVLGAQAFSAGAAFRFSGLAVFVFNTIGASGNGMGSIMVNLTQSASTVAPPGTYTQGNFQAAASYGLADSTTGASGAIDTTADNTMFVQCAWGNTTGAPTLTNRHTLFRKSA